MAEHQHRRGLPLKLAGQLLAASQPLLLSFVPAMVENLSRQAAGIRASFIPNLEDMAKKGHLRGLSRALAGPTKAKVYEGLSYRTFDVAFPIPLGDSLTLIQVEGTRRFKPFFEKDDQFQAIYLPLTSSRELVGSSGSFEPRLEELPAAIAQSSLEVFICSAEHHALRVFQSQIGSNAYLVSKADLDEMLTEILYPET